MPGYRVLQLNSRLTGGGTDDHCLHLCAGLRALGHEPWLLAPAQGPLAESVRRMGLSCLPLRTAGPLKVGLIARAAHVIRGQGLELVHAHHGCDYWPAILSARLSGRRPRVVLTRHLAKSPRSWFSHRFLLGHCDAVLGVSNYVARVLRVGDAAPDSPVAERRRRPPLRGDHAKVQVAYGGIDTDRFRPAAAAGQREAWGLTPEHYAFGVVGGYAPPVGKGQREFLAAAALMQDEAPQARFLIVGRGALAETLSADIQRLGLANRARLTGYCADMPQAMNALDCLVHPQIGTEAFGLVVLEAFACGKPVITTALDGLPEAFAVGGYGRLVPDAAPAGLAQAMLAQLREGGLGQAERIALHRRVADGFSVEAMAKRVAGFYEQLLAELSEREPRTPALP